MDPKQKEILETVLGHPTAASIIFFLIIVAVTLVITYWASKRTKTTAQYYAAGRGISALQNGLALGGDYMSAASFLGIAGMVALKGYDGMIYATGWLVGWPALMFLIAEPLRNLGKFTFADVVAFRLKQTPVRIAAAIGGLLTVIVYATAQMVGAGNLIKLMFGINYELAIIIVGVVMIAYVLFGGMLATTWVQIIKAVLLLGGVTLLTIIVLSKFGFNPGKLYGEVTRAANIDAKGAPTGEAIGVKALQPGGQVKNPLDTISLGLALMFGLLGLPHILMRFYTVPDSRAARKSVVWATTFIGYFYLIIPIVGFGASVLVGRELIFMADKGGNMAAPLLAYDVGGAAFMGFIAAVAFATILAVVAGLTLAGASALSHDLFVHVVRKGHATEQEQVRVARYATVFMGIVAILIGIVMKGQNVAYMVGLAFAIAASANFPALLMSIVWKGFTTAGAVSSTIVGSVLAVFLIIIGPAVWEDTFKNAVGSAPLSLRNPGIISIPAAFIVGIVVSLVSRERAAEEKFDAEKIRVYLGVGAE